MQEGNTRKAAPVVGERVSVHFFFSEPEIVPVAYCRFVHVIIRLMTVETLQNAYLFFCFFYIRCFAGYFAELADKRCGGRYDCLLIVYLVRRIICAVFYHIVNMRAIESRKVCGFFSHSGGGKRFNRFGNGNAVRIKPCSAAFIVFSQNTHHNFKIFRVFCELICFHHQKSRPGRVIKPYHVFVLQNRIIHVSGFGVNHFALYKFKILHKALKYFGVLVRLKVFSNQKRHSETLARGIMVGP